MVNQYSGFTIDGVRVILYSLLVTSSTRFLISTHSHAQYDLSIRLTMNADEC